MIKFKHSVTMLLGCVSLGLQASDYQVPDEIAEDIQVIGHIAARKFKATFESEGAMGSAKSSLRGQVRRLRDPMLESLSHCLPSTESEFRREFNLRKAGNRFVSTVRVDLIDEPVIKFFSDGETGLQAMRRKVRKRPKQFYRAIENIYGETVGLSWDRSRADDVAASLSKELGRDVKFVRGVYYPFHSKFSSQDCGCFGPSRAKQCRRRLLSEKRYERGDFRYALEFQVKSELSYDDALQDYRRRYKKAQEYRSRRRNYNGGGYSSSGGSSSTGLGFGMGVATVLALSSGGGGCGGFGF